VAAPHFVQDLYKLVARPRRTEERSPLITTEGHKVQVALPIETLERIAHIGQREERAEEKPAPLKPKGAAPSLHVR